MTQDQLIRRIEDLMCEIRRLKADNAELRDLVEQMEQELTLAKADVKTLIETQISFQIEDRISPRSLSEN